MGLAFNKIVCDHSIPDFVRDCLSSFEEGRAQSISEGPGWSEPN